MKLTFSPAGSNIINQIKSSKQIFSDCYLTSSLEALTNSVNGKKIISNNVKYKNDIDVPKILYSYHDEPEQSILFKMKFPNVDNKAEEYNISPKDIFEILCKLLCLGPTPERNVFIPFEAAMDKLIKEHFFKKPIVSRLITDNAHRFEYNKPSNFMRMFTGKEPIVLNENTVWMSLKKKSGKAFDLFEKMGNTPNNNYSFVIGTGESIMGNHARWHCYTITNADNQTRRISIKEKRHNVQENVSYDEAIKAFKFIVGYFDDMLK